jgi:hypothetical protein
VHRSRALPAQTRSSPANHILRGRFSTMHQISKCQSYKTLLPADMPVIKNIRQITRNRNNKNLAIPATAAAMPVNPKGAANSAITEKSRPNAASFHLLRRESQQLMIARVFSLTNPKRLRDALSLHYEHNFVNYSHSAVNRSVTYVAV